MLNIKPMSATQATHLSSDEKARLRADMLSAAAQMDAMFDSLCTQGE